MEIKITIPLAPVTKKNSQSICVNRKTGKPFVRPSAQYEAYEKAALWHIRWKRAAIAVPVNVQCVYYMPTRRRVDLVNLQEATLDVLVAARVLADDNSRIVTGMDGSRVFYDKGNPRTEIRIAGVQGTESI